MVEWDIAARERHVIGEGPRIAPVPNEEVAPDLRAIVDDVRIAAGTHPVAVLPEYMRMMMHHPRLFRSQMDLGVVFFQGTLPLPDRELAILRVGWLCGAPYEWGQHVGMARRAGLSAEQIERVREGSQASGWTAHERAIVRGVEELLEDKALSDETWDTLALTWDKAQLIEFPSMIGQYVAIAMVQNTLRTPLEVGNPGLSHR